jgi:tripartite-type tricarboxylate transporter receptor subunit TctC
MNPNRAVCCYLLLAAAIGVRPAMSANADPSYPTKPIRLIVPQAPGGSNDILARYISQYLGGRFGKQVVVDNRAGADALIGTDMAARSAPDGYTLLLASSAYTMNPAVRKVPYDPLKAFDWIAMLGSGPTALHIGPSLPVNSVKELLAVAKAKPGQLTMASAGGFGHFAHALFNNLAGGHHHPALQGGFDDRRHGRPGAHHDRLHRSIADLYPPGS